MRKGRVLLFVFLLLASTQADFATANKNGRYNSTGGCGCHSGGAGGVNAILSGLPSVYTPGDTYNLGIAMSGNPLSGGFNLETSKGTLSNPSGAAKVSSNGYQATHKTWTSTSWTVDWTAPASGSGTVQFNLAVLHGNNGQNTGGDLYGTSSTSVGEDVNVNSPPTAADLVITPAVPTTGDDLTLTYTYADDDGDIESGTTVVWHLNGAAQTGQTSTTLSALATTKGDAWHAVVTPSDGEDSGTPVASNSIVISNTMPEVLSIAVSSETPDTNDDITFTFQSDDADNDAIAATEIRWRLEGAVVASLDNATTLPAVATRAGDTWAVEVRISDGEDMSPWFMSQDMLVGSSNQPPVIDAVVVSPTDASTLDDLTATWTASDPDGDEIVQTEILWMRNGVHEIEADGLNPLPSDRTTKGEVWTAAVRASDGETWSLVTESTGQTIGNAAPVVLEAVLTSPTFTALHPLGVNITTADPDGDDVQITEVQWYLNDVEQNFGSDAFAVNASFLQRGDTWHAVVTIDDGTDLTFFTTEPVVILNAAPQVTVAWPSETTSLVDLVPTITVVDVDDDLAVISTTWYKNGFRDASLTNATSVGAEKLAPEQTWRIVVNASDGQETTSNEATVILTNLQPQASISVVSTEVWFGETTVLSATTSADADGEIVRYIWTWDGTSASGSVVSMVLTKTTEVHLLVVDDTGATAETTVELTVSTGPSVQNLRISDDGAGAVDLSWMWPGGAVDFNILRNGEVVATTSSLAYRDRPPMSGLNDYTVQPVNDERVFLHGAEQVSTVLQPVIAEEPGPASGLGFGLGTLMLLALLIAPFLGKRNGGGGR